ncbi:MAG TPA: hypothetical protein VK806_12335 [Bacteroidia bacterium]|jgi:hypothetical protein|nr:hypothetical protein [Bacteroidia bacterium]
MVGFSVKRPKVVSILCIIGWIMVVFSFLNAFSPAVKKLGQFYPAIYSLVMCLQFIAFVGIWYMKRWGLELFILSFFGKAVLLLFMNDFSYGDLTFLLSAIFIIILVFFYKKMDMNL